eukprot:Nk52_evm1s210 gene=Nk52_evmTU1s210
MTMLSSQQRQQSTNRTTMSFETTPTEPAAAPGRSANGQGKKKKLRNIWRCDWLELQSSVLKVWKRRWAILDDERVCFYAQSKEDRHKGFLADFVLYNDILKVMGPEEGHILLLKTSKRVYKVKCYTKERAEDWKTDIEYRANKKDK